MVCVGSGAAEGCGAAAMAEGGGSAGGEAAGVAPFLKEQLRLEAERLARSTRRLIWLNPLLRFDGFQPEAAGIKALMPIVDSLHSCHSVDRLEALGQSFATNGLRNHAKRSSST